MAKGITNVAVIEAMMAVPRHLFLPEAMERDAYGSSALPIGSGQTISAPHIVGLMTEALQLHGEEKVLEVGTGSGYQAAVLARLTGRVITVERIPELARRVQSIFSELRLDGIVVKVGDGTQGYAENTLHEPSWTPSPESDFAAVSEGYVSVTPLLLDLTDDRRLGILKTLDLNLR